MMLLPSGHAMFANGTNDVEIYLPGDDPESSQRPHISEVPHHVLKGQTFELKGRQLNGLSQAVSYGDDATMATNYPLVQIRHEGSNAVHFCRTRDHSTMGVATGSIQQSTKFDVPLSIPSREIPPHHRRERYPLRACLGDGRLTILTDSRRVTPS